MTMATFHLIAGVLLIGAVSPKDDPLLISFSLTLGIINFIFMMNRIKREIKNG